MRACYNRVSAKGKKSEVIKGDHLRASKGEEMEQKKPTFKETAIAEFDLLDQDILLGRWGNGDFKEHMKHLPKSLFTRQNVYEAIEQGLDFAEMASKKIIGYSELTGLLENSNYDTFYYSAYKKGLNEKAKRLERQYLDAKNTQDSLRLIKAIEETYALIEDRAVVPQTENFTEVLEKELDRRANEHSAQYGIIDLDYATGGIHRGQLIVVGARPSVGKSAFTLQIADNVRKAGKKVLYLPLEMTAFETFERLLVREDIAEQRDFKKGELTQEQKEQAKAYLKELEESKNFIMFEGLNNLEDIKAEITKKKPYLVVIDQLTQVRTNNKYSQLREKIKDITSTLKAIALQENVAIILVSQLNREAVERTRGALESLAESDSIGQDADVVLTLTAEKEEDEKPRFKEVKLDIVKQRQGQSGKQIKLIFEGAKYSFKNAQKGADVEGFSLIKDIDF